jgi:hypothetical protein
MTPELIELIKDYSRTNTILTIVTIIAVFAGPLLAVRLTRSLDLKREERQRKFQIFKDLMTTRSTQINYEHVKALNAIEVEFYNDEKIIYAWKKYMECLTELSMLKPVINPSNQKEIDEFIKNQSENLIFHQKKQTLFAKLVHEIARYLKIEIEQLDILAPGYAPQGWLNDENEQRALRKGLIELLDLKRSLPIWVTNMNHKEETNTKNQPAKKEKHKEENRA